MTGRLAFRLFSPKKELWSLRPTVQIPLSLLRVNEHIFLRISFDTSEFSGLYSVNLTDASECLLVEINETGSKVRSHFKHPDCIKKTHPNLSIVL